MTHYGGKELEASFRTVRKNTLTIAEELTEEQYGYKATPDVRSAGEMLAHIAVSTRWQKAFHSTPVDFFDFALFVGYMQQTAAEASALHTKDRIVAALKEDGEDFAAFLGSLSDDVLAQRIGFPPPVQPSSKSRLEMLIGTREHEIHHRAQLMLIQRLHGIVPHLTRQREAMMAPPVR